MLFRTLFAIVAVLLISACATAPNATATLEWAGTFSCPDSAHIRTVSSGVPRRPILLVSECVRESESSTVVAELNTSFGIWYSFQGRRSGSIVDYQVIWRFPEPGLVHPTTGRRMEVSSMDRRCYVGETCNAGQTIARQWELVPGTWTVEIWARNQKLLQYAFDVSVP